MGLLGTLVGGGLGFMMFGPLGAILGGAIGSNIGECGRPKPLWRRNNTGPRPYPNPYGGPVRDPRQVQQAFLIAMISLAAKVAKADGRVTAEEVRSFDTFLRDRLGMSAGRPPRGRPPVQRGPRFLRCRPTNSPARSAR